MDIAKLIRPDLQKLKPYSSARDEFQGIANIYIDANENPFDNDVNRYPDPLQKDLKQRISEIKNIDVNNLFLGNGSDEVLDLLFRLFCIPGKDEVIISSPTYGMYKVLAGINNVSVIDVHLKNDFQLDVDNIIRKSSLNTKIVFLCSPNNPTGNILNKKDVMFILNNFEGIVVIDEAYQDFSKEDGFAKEVENYPNLVVTQTLSKAWGMAGLRLGIGICSNFIVQQLNKIKPPYNINVLTQRFALDHLNDIEGFNKRLSLIKAESDRLAEELSKLPMVRKIYSTETNFLLVEFLDANLYYDKLLDKGIVVRNRSKQIHCENCLRITVGTKIENDSLINTLKTFK